MSMLVTGATGKLGSKVVEHLLKSVSADQLAVSVRDPNKAEGLRARGVEVRHGDFDRPETLDNAFAGVERLLLISTDGDNDTRIRQHGHAVEAAKRAGVQRIVYTSLARASDSKLMLAPVHKFTEEAIRSAGMPYTFLRNNWYLENEAPSIQAVMAGAPWITSAGSGRVGWAAQQDYAAAAAAALTGSGHENKSYELSGPPLTQEQFAAELSAVLGKEVLLQQVDDAAYADIMKGAGVPDFIIPMLVAIQQGIREGELDVDRSDFATLLGRPTTPIKDALAEIIRG